MTEVSTLRVGLVADTGEFKREIGEAEKLAAGFARTMTRAFAGAAVQGRGLGDVLRSLALQLSSMAISATLKPLQQGFADLPRFRRRLCGAW